MNKYLLLRFFLCKTGLENHCITNVGNRQDHWSVCIMRRSLNFDLKLDSPVLCGCFVMFCLIDCSLLFCADKFNKKNKTCRRLSSFKKYSSKAANKSKQLTVSYLQACLNYSFICVQKICGSGQPEKKKRWGKRAKEVEG